MTSLRKLILGGFAAVVSTAADGGPDKTDPHWPAEETRLDTQAFREGLKRRGLTEVLEQHLREFPPAGNVAASLAIREVKLAEAADTRRPRAERAAAQTEANQILESLLEREKTDPRRFDWRFTLAHSLLFDEGEPFSMNLLYRGESASDRGRLRPLTDRALAHAEILTEGLAAEYRRLDEVSVGEFERLERAGVVEHIDRLAPRVEYLLLWSLFYGALSRDEADPGRIERLHRIKQILEDQRAYVTTPHANSRVQIQILLLAGMVHRRLNDHPASRDFFDRSLSTADRLLEKQERDRVDWAVRLAWIERIRNECDDGRHEEGLTLLRKFRIAYALGGEATHGLNLTAALLERWVHRSRAEAADRAGRPGDALRYRDEAWLCLVALARKDDAYRDELYAVLNEGPMTERDPSTLDPFERCALVAGLLSEAHQAGPAAASLLESAVDLGGRFAVENSDASRTLAPELLPEILYNVGVALYRLDRPSEASRQFLTVAQQHRAFRKASESAEFAVQLARKGYAGSGGAPDSSLSSLYREALHTVVTDYAGIDKGCAYRFAYARLLNDLGEWDLADAQYAFVPVDHERYAEALFQRVQCQALALERFSREHSKDTLEVRRRLQDFLTIHRTFTTYASDAGNRPNESESTLRGFLAGSRVLLAEIQVLGVVDRAAHALETLENWDAEFPKATEWLGRVWRVRILAYERLQRLDDATRALPAYLAADPKGAGSTLQSLYLAMAADVENLRAAGNAEAARQKADAALVLAQKLCEWASSPAGMTASIDARPLKLQLAEAYLAAGRFEQARDEFLSAVPGLANPSVTTGGIDPRILHGYAASLQQLQEYGNALAFYNGLSVSLPPGHPLRWKSLLGDLQCRTALGQPPDGIIQVIQQQRYLYPDLGGPALSARFQELLRENERRRSGG